MSSSALDQAAARQMIIDSIRGEHFRRAMFAGPIRSRLPCRWVRIAIRPIEVRGERRLQFAYFDSRKNITKNFAPAQSEGPLAEVLDIAFARIHLSTAAEDIDIQTTRKGKVLVGRRRAAAAAGPLASHNRVKQLPLPEGRADPLLEMLGILTRSGRVRPSKRAKYTQINELLKHLIHVLGDAQLRSLGRDLQILDCGCGSSYLTFAVHHYLNNIAGIPARILGVDVNDELIRKSVERSQDVDAKRLNFACVRIDAVALKPDVVLALHACDTATDDALAQAIKSETRLILSVPCCHHHLNDQLRPAGPAEVLRPLLRHGILQQRAADLVTDAFRALILRIMGYRTEVVEFISPEHTARNLMIRAMRGAAVAPPALVEEYRSMRRFCGVTPYLEQALGEDFEHLLAGRGDEKSPPPAS